jgi:hypothetical protein
MISGLIRDSSPSRTVFLARCLVSGEEHVTLSIGSYQEREPAHRHDGMFVRIKPMRGSRAESLGLKTSWKRESSLGLVSSVESESASNWKGRDMND